MAQNEDEYELCAPEFEFFGPAISRRTRQVRIVAMVSLAAHRSSSIGFVGRRFCCNQGRPFVGILLAHRRLLSSNLRIQNQMCGPTKPYSWSRRPTSFLHCFLPCGGVDFGKFRAYRKHRSQKIASLLTSAVKRSWSEQATDSGGTSCEPQVKKRRKPRKVLAYRTENGDLEHIKPTESAWYLLYVIGPDLEDPKFHSTFRDRFRLPYHCYRQLVDEAKERDWFPRWSGIDCCGSPATPLDLLVLGSLRYLGRGWTFDDLVETTAVSFDCP